MDLRHELDQERDLMTFFYKDAPVVDSIEIELFGCKHVSYVDKDGELVKSEVYDYSKLLEKQKERNKSVFTSESDSPGPIGTITWEAYDSGGNTPVDSGTQSVYLKEVTIQVVDRDKVPLVSKSFAIGSLFSFGISGGSSTDENIGGFGLQALRVNERSFCWEWFNVLSPDRATKLQETGELAIRSECHGGIWQIVSTEFLTDVSLRVMRMDGLPNPKAPEWRVTIKKGSRIAWPCLVDGTIESTLGESR